MAEGSNIPAEFVHLVPTGFKLSPNESLDTCPYNRSHYCLAHKASQHAKKCRLAYIKTKEDEGKEVDLVTCKHYTGHKYPTVEMAWHEERCFLNKNPHLKIDISVVPNNSTERPFTPKVKPLTHYSTKQLQMVKDEYNRRGIEDWDVEIALHMKTHVPFNPIYAIVENGVPMLPPGLTKSERRKFREYHQELANVERGGTYIPRPSHSDNINGSAWK